MPAELGRPAQLDRAHYTPLDAPEMSGTGLPVGVAVTAENIRHLQLR
jgi:hypothetical protein